MRIPSGLHIQQVGCGFPDCGWLHQHHAALNLDNMTVVLDIWREHFKVAHGDELELCKQLGELQTMVFCDNGGILTIIESPAEAA